jgi:hypothetical protein
MTRFVIHFDRVLQCWHICCLFIKPFVKKHILSFQKRRSFDSPLAKADLEAITISQYFKAAP